MSVHYVYAFKGDRLFTSMITDAACGEIGGLVSRLRDRGWRVFWRRLR